MGRKLDRKLLLPATILFCAMGAAWAQSIQVDHSELDGSATSWKDAKLVSVPAPPATEQQQFEQAVKDIHFDFDRAELRPEDRAILASDAEWLKAHSDVMITLEGDADERGDIIYNVVLSGERANAAKDALVELGVAEGQIAFATGWGKLYPVCTESERIVGVKTGARTFQCGLRRRSTPTWLRDEPWLCDAMTRKTLQAKSPRPILDSWRENETS